MEINVKFIDFLSEKNLIITKINNTHAYTINLSDIQYMHELVEKILIASLRLFHLNENNFLYKITNINDFSNIQINPQQLINQSINILYELNYQKNTNYEVII